MVKGKGTQLEPDKVFDPDAIRLNLMMSALYLTAFELLKLSIIDGVAERFLQGLEYDDNQLEELRQLEEEEAKLREWSGVDFRAGPLTRYREMVAQYESEVELRLSWPDARKLVPSAKWLAGKGVLTDQDVALIRAIRDHRNRIAHELPSILLGDALDVNGGLFANLRDLLRKSDLYWIRTDLHCDMQTAEEGDTSLARYDEVFSGREAMLQIVISAVVDYAATLANSGGRRTPRRGNALH